MANHEQLEKLRQGVKEWNAWRAASPAILIDLSYADLNHDFLEGADLSHANLQCIRLYSASLQNTDLSHTNLYNAILWGARLHDADLSHAYLEGADLSYANLSYVNFNGAIFSKTQLTNANLMGTNFGNVDLRTVEGLETVQYVGPSTIGIDTIYRSQGRIPKIFLQKAGVPESFIEYMDALIGATKPIEYATCFISYSDKDRSFAERLYNDLQSRKVRCWYAPHSLKIGDRYRPMIDQAIHAHDKLLLVLSEHSTTSQWVEFEVERALSRERKEQRDIIFPIRIDQSIMNEHTAWANHLKDTRHIGDFEQWEDEKQYQTAFTRLLSDLQRSTEAEQ